MRENIYSNSRVLSLSGDVNFRDCGGYLTLRGNHIKTGMLYRSATLSRITEEDIRQVERLGLNRVIDLRTRREIELGGYDRIYPGNEACYDFFDFGYGDPYLSEARVSSELEWDMKQVDFPSIYVHMLEQNKPAIKRIFDRFADPLQYPILIHCTQGKDRTGIIVALLLLMLDVPRATISEDYMLTDKLVDAQAKLREMERYLDDYKGSVPAGITARDWAPFFTCLPQSLENLLDHLEMKYNGGTHFLESIEIDSERQGIIRDILLEE